MTSIFSISNYIFMDTNTSKSTRVSKSIWSRYHTNRITGSFEGCDAVLFFTGVTIRYAPSSTVLVGEKYQVSIFPCTVVVKLSIILDTFYSNKYHAARLKHS